MRTEHRADYLRERGTWHATCRACGFQTSDPLRNRAATQFRSHIRQMDSAVIDLTPEAPRTASWSTYDLAGERRVSTTESRRVTR